jgi:NAD(P)-dependent dehydrogenase (short-subunit alcohol dehydrogenase family)
MLLRDRTAIITGASEGMGFAIAEQYVKVGASVMICARSPDRLNQAKTQLLSQTVSPGQTVEAFVADISSPSDVDALVDRALSVWGKIDILVNNAGVYGPRGALEDVNWQDWVDAIHINLMGLVYCCRAIVPHMKKNGYGKIVNLSGGGATNPLPNITAYAASKAAAVRFAESLALEVKDHGIDVNSIAPGALLTRLNQELLNEGPAAVGQAFYDRMHAMLKDGGTPLSKGASLAVYLGSAESDGITGKLISAQWDPWPSLAGHKDDLEKTDVYTIRRIIPKDRGMDWGDV